MIDLASTTVDLARLQFATTSIYHFLFVSLTLGLAPLVATMQTIWHRTHDDAWLRLTHFFGRLLLINFPIGVGCRRSLHQTSAQALPFAPPGARARAGR